MNNNYETSYSVEDTIKTEAKNIVNGIENNKHIVEEIKNECGITGKEDYTTLKNAAAQGNIAAQYYFAMANKTPGSVSGTGFDYGSVNYLKNSADSGFPLASTQYGLVLMKENQTSEGLEYIIDGANHGDHEAIYALATFYQNYAEDLKGEEYKKYMTAAATWYTVGLSLGVEKICLRSETLDRILKNIRNGSSGKGKKKKSAAKSSSGSSFQFDKKIIIIILLILFLIIFILVGIFFVVPLIKDLLGMGNASVNDNDINSNSDLTIYAPGLESGDGEFNLDGYEYHFSYDENGNQIIILGPNGEQLEATEKEDFLVEITPDAETVPDIEAAPVLPTYIVIANSGLHLRTEPSTDAESLLVMDKGDIVHMEYMENGWAKVYYDNLEGFCKAEYIEPYDGEDIPEIDTEHMIVDMFVIANSGLRLRTDPDLNADTIVVMPYGSKVYVYDNSNPEWYFVEFFDSNFNPYSGWCSSEYLDYMEPTISASSSDDFEYTEENRVVDLYVSNKNGAPLYTSADKNSKVIITMPYGARVDMYEWGINGFYRVSCKLNGSMFYGFTSDALDISCPYDTWKVIAPNETYLYSNPSEDSSKLFTLYKNDRVVLVIEPGCEVQNPDTLEYWWKVSYISGNTDKITGWCRSSALENCFGSFNE
ncbi:MAG: SH3 domain-containing protein [Ruminococcaceae bacterium]|nr:SH3 domain-containing protein [Oscillospiraceae bacterium]